MTTAAPTAAPFAAPIGAPTIGRGRRAVEVALVVLAAGAATLPWLRAFPTDLLLPVLLPMVLLPVAVTVVTAAVARFTSPAWWIPAHLLVLVVVVLLVGGGHPFALADISAGYGNGLARLLSITLPITTVPELLVLPATLTWLVTVVVAESALRARAFGVAAAAAVLGFLAAYAVTTDSAGSSLAPAVLLCLAVLALLGVPRWMEAHAADDAETAGATPPFAGTSEPPTARRSWSGAGWVTARSARSGVLWAAVVLLAAGILVPRLPAFAEAPVASTRETPTERPAAASPLATTAALRRGTDGVGPDDPLFAVRGVTAESRYLALTQLDVYDGGTWRLDRRFEPTGGRVPPDPLVGATTTADQTVVLGRIVDTPAAPWLPQAGRPAEIRGIDVRFEPVTGMVVPASVPDPGSTYDVRSTVPAGSLPSDGGLFAATEGSHANDVPLDLGRELDRWITTVARNRNLPQTPTPAFLTAVADEIRQRYAVVDDGGGTSFAEVSATLGANRAATPEQFATLYAMVARRSGVDARVVTGFRIGGPAGDGLPAPGEEVDVRGRDAWTWVIVPVVGVGWVVVDPSPDRSVPPAQERAAAASTTTTIPPEQPRTGGPRPTTVTPIDTTAVSVPPPPPDDRVRNVLVGLAVLAVLALAVLSSTALGRVRRRRRRERAPDPRWRVVGAWHELLEAADRRGLVDGDQLAAATTTEAVALLEGAGIAADGAAPELITTVNRAVHAPDPPTPADADRTWAISRDLTRRAAAQRPPLGRVVDWFRRPTMATVRRRPVAP